MTSMDVDDGGAVTTKSEVPNKSLGPSYTQHLSQFHQVISKLQQAIQLMITNKANGIIDDHASLPLRITSLVTEMKTLNRTLNHTMDRIRTNVQTEKSAFDRVSLDLQALLYEKQHLQKQIRNQQHFKSKQKPIEMIPLEEFMALPSTQAQLAARSTPATPHDIHLLRLQHELAERKNLVGRVEELSLRKRSLFDLNDKRRTQLRTVQSKLAALYADAMPILTLLNMGTMEMIPVPESVQELPLPLYHLYHSALCYQRAFDSDNQFTVTIDGDITRAHTLKSVDDMTTPTTTLPLDLPTLTSTYPLEIVMELKSNGVNVTLRIKWMIHLKTVTVTVDMKGGAATTAASSSTPSLVNLYPDDAGTEWPNDLSTVLSAPAAVEFHRRFKLDPITLGTPYRWAQSLCGLHYPHPRHPSYPHPGLADVLKQIHMRVAIKQALHAQISTLVRKSYPFPDPSDDHPLKSRATLTKFTRTQKTEWDSIVLRTHGETHGNEYVEGADYYSVQLKRDEAILNGVIRITPEYPIRPPTFVLAYGHAAPALVPSKLVKQSSDPEALALAQSAGARATVVDNNIKEMEILANTHFSAPLTQLAQLEARGQAHVLAYQLRSLHMMFDLAGEPEISGTTTQGLRDRFYERAVRGRDRRRPFLYDPTQHSFDQF